MSTRTIYLVAAFAAVAMLGIAGVAFAASGASKKAPRVVPIVMADPGCHWFKVGGKSLAKLTVTGRTIFRNLDEAAIVFKGKNFLGRVAVGKTIGVAKPGLYRITMVGQHPDDNTLLLTVR